MKSSLRAAGLLFAVVLPWTSIQRADAAAYPSISVAFDSVALRSVETDRVRFDLNVEVTSDTRLKTNRLQFEQMRLGTMPIYLSPVDQPLQLDKGEPVTLPSVPLTIFFRDLDSLEPLQQVVRDGRASVTGDVHVELQLNLLEHLATRQWSNYADMPVAVTAPVEIPGGFLGQTAALGSLAAAQLAMDAGSSALSFLRVSQRAWERELKTRYTPSMVIAESRYTLHTSNDQRISFAVRGLGFRISKDRFVLTNEMIKPWSYDLDVATAIQSGKASLVENSPELLVSPGAETFDANTARSISQRQIRLEHQSDKSDKTLVPTEKGAKEIQVLRRDKEDNYAVLRFTRPEDQGAPVPIAPDSVRNSDDWDRLAMFFVDHTGKLELVSSAARRQDKRIIFDDPIDDRAFGSLLIAPEGAIGMVQDEHTGIPMKSAW